jgi:hypothetical protein
MPTPILAYNPPYGLPPTPIPPGPRIRWEYHPEIVALLTADGEPSLQELVTAGYFLVESRVEINIDVDGSTESQSWVLMDGTASGSDVQPDDYDLATNNVRWEKVG